MRGNRKSQPDTTYIPPDNLCQMLGTHMCEGLSFTSFAGVLGISRQTLYNLLDKYPEFKTTREVCEMKALLFWEKIQVQVASGELNHPRPTNLMFTLHTRFPAEFPRENEAPPIDQYEFAAEVAEQLAFLQSE